MGLPSLTQLSSDFRIRIHRSAAAASELGVASFRAAKIRWRTVTLHCVEYWGARLFIAYCIMGLASLQPPSVKNRKTLAALAPAKINLVLEVLDRRGDGFHDIHSLAIGVGLFDSMTCSWPNDPGLTVNCSDPTLHSESNLATRAALLVARHVGCDPQVRIDLEKHIPMGAGLGGGSSDAATTMRACNAIWNAGLTDAEMAQLGAELGSDVPLFFHLPAAEMSGRGECVAPVTLRWRGTVLLVFPGIHVNTADAYKAWRKQDCASSQPTSFETLAATPRADDLHHQIHNDLESAVFRVCPRVKEVQDHLAGMGLPPTRMTGSGSALFRLFDDEDQARHAERTIRKQSTGLKVEVVAGPVGAPAFDSKES